MGECGSIPPHISSYLEAQIDSPAVATSARACFFLQATGEPALAAVYPLTNFVDTEGVALLRGRAVVLSEERSGALVEVQTAAAPAPAPAQQQQQQQYVSHLSRPQPLSASLSLHLSAPLSLSHGRSEMRGLRPLSSPPLTLPSPPLPSPR